MPARGGGDGAEAAHEVEEAIESLPDPEASAALPSASLVAAAGLARDLHPVAPGTSAEIWRLAWPAMLSQLLISVVGLVDIAMLGRFGPAAQAAVGYATQIFHLTQSALFAIGFACVALMARAIGARNPERARQALAGSLVFAVVVATGFAAAILSAPERVLGWLAAEPDVVALCVPYLQLLLLASILLSVSLTLESALRADRNPRTPMRIAVVVTAVKIALNALLIFGWLGFPRLGVVGAGLATLGAQVVGLFLFARAIRRAGPEAPFALRRGDFAGARGLARDLVRVAVPGIAERAVMNLALLVYFTLLGGYGTVAVAAYTVGVRVLSFSWIPGTGYAQAVATLVAQALGTGDERGAEHAGWRAARLALVTSLVLGVPCALAGEQVARLFTSDPETVAALVPFMICLAIAQPALQVHFTLGGAHRGAGDTWTPLTAAFVSNWVIRVPVAFVFAKVLETPLVWVWAALILDHVTRCLWLAVTFRRGAWRHRLGGTPALATRT